MNPVEGPVLILGNQGTLYGSIKKTKSIKIHMNVFVHCDYQRLSGIIPSRLDGVYENGARII